VWLQKEMWSKPFLMKYGWEKQVDVGSVQERLDLVSRLECHDFDWYVERIYPELREQLG